MLIQGVAFALAAGLMWGLVFIAPVLLPEYPAAILSVGRYLAFGLIALPLAWLDRDRIMRLQRADWIEATKLSLVGNLIYYAFLAAAIQLAGAPLPTMIIGTLPLVISVFGNVGAGKVPWSRLAAPLGAIAAGIMLVNRDELMHLGDGRPWTTLAIGAALAVVAVAAWTWYPIRNAAWLRAHPGLLSSTWATAQGLMTLPLALVGWIAIGVFAAAGGVIDYRWPLGARPLEFVGLMLTIGLTASWLGTLCWNRASKLLPTALVGQLIVFETLSALAYAFLLRGQVPGAGTMAGIALLVIGVLAGVRVFQVRGVGGPPQAAP